MVYKNISHFAVMLKLIMIDKVQYFFYFLHFFVVQLLTKFLRAHNIILHKISYNVEISLFCCIGIKWLFQELDTKNSTYIHIISTESESSVSLTTKFENEHF